MPGWVKLISSEIYTLFVKKVTVNREKELKEGERERERETEIYKEKREIKLDKQTKGEKAS